MYKFPINIIFNKINIFKKIIISKEKNEIYQN